MGDLGSDFGYGVGDLGFNLYVLQHMHRHLALHYFLEGVGDSNVIDDGLAGKHLRALLFVSVCEEPCLQNQHNERAHSGGLSKASASRHGVQGQQWHQQLATLTVLLLKDPSHLHPIGLMPFCPTYPSDVA